MFAKKNVLVVLALAMLPALTCQAAWMRQEGEIAASVGLSASEINTSYDRAGSLIQNTCSAAVDVPINVEFGATYYNTYFANTSISSFDCLNPLAPPGTTSRVTDFSDIELGVRGRINVATSDKIWEVAAIIPNYVDPNGAARQPKHAGIRFGLHSSNRVDPYQSFLAGDDSTLNGPNNVVSYGAGYKLWAGPIPNELSAYVGFMHVISGSQWKQDTGGWYFNSRLEWLQSFGKETTVTPGLLVRDIYDRFSLVTAHAGFSHSLTQSSALHFSVKHGLWGRNTSRPAGINFGYSKVWRN